MASSDRPGNRRRTARDRYGEDIEQARFEEHHLTIAEAGLRRVSIIRVVHLTGAMATEKYTR
jgi:hypothetical protein